MSTPGKELLTNISQLSSKEYLRRALGHHVQQRILTDEINAHLAGRRLLAAYSGLDNARAASESSDDRILARDTSTIMMAKTPSPEMAELLALTEDELEKPSHVFAVLQVDSVARSRSTPRTFTLNGARPALTKIVD